MNLTREELEAMGLSEEEIQAVLGSVEEGGGSLPFPLLKINYDADIGKRGQWGFNPEKNDDKETVGYEYMADEIKVRFLKAVYQYSFYDSSANKTTIASNIFTSLGGCKSAKDLKSGKSIESLQNEIGEKIPLNKIFLGVIEIGGEWKPFIYYANKSSLWGMNEALDSLPNKGVLQVIVNLSLKKNKKGNVTWFVPVLENYEEVAKTDFIKNIKIDTPKIKEFNNWVDGINGGASPSKKEASTTDTTDDVDVDEELPF